MPRRLRYQHEEWTVHFVTARCIQGRYLLRPDGEVCALMVGVLERASKMASVALHGAVALSNHMHLLVSSQTPADLARYMAFVDGNVSAEVGRVHDWPGAMWDGRYDSAPCLDEAAQLDRLGYLLSNSVKESLVKRAWQWPGLHTYSASCQGKPLRGYWVDRTALGEARRSRRGEVREEEFREHCTLTLHKLPALAHLDDAQYAAAVKQLYLDAVAKHRPDPSAPVLGVARVLAMDPHQRAPRKEGSPAPMCHAASERVREAFREGYERFVEAYRALLADLRGGLDPDDPILRQGVLPGGLHPAPP